MCSHKNICIFAYSFGPLNKTDVFFFLPKSHFLFYQRVIAGILCQLLLKHFELHWICLKDSIEIKLIEIGSPH